MADQTDKMNVRQKIAYKNILDFALMGGHYEVKELRVRKLAYCSDVFVSMTTGMPNDEGTMAEALCRDTYLFFIGPRGGIFQYANKGHERVYRKYYNIATI